MAGRITGAMGEALGAAPSPSSCAAALGLKDEDTPAQALGTRTFHRESA